jgi:hypothetical protein
LDSYIAYLLARHKVEVFTSYNAAAGENKSKEIKESFKSVGVQIISVSLRSKGRMGQLNQSSTQLCSLQAQSWQSQDWVVDFGSKLQLPGRMGTSYLQGTHQDFTSSGNVQRKKKSTRFRASHVKTL